MKNCIFKNYYKKLNKDNNNGDPFQKGVAIVVI